MYRSLGMVLVGGLFGFLMAVPALGEMKRVVQFLQLL